MSGQVVQKNPSQKFQYEKGMEVLAGKNEQESHGSHVLSNPQFGAQIQPSSIYTNVAMQMTPPSSATNTASGTKA